MTHITELTSDNKDREQMHFKRMHGLNSYQQCLTVVKFEMERLKEFAANKSHSAVVIAQAKPKAKNGKTANKRMRGASPKKWALCGKKSNEGGKSNGHMERNSIRRQV